MHIIILWVTTFCTDNFVCRETRLNLDYRNDKQQQNNQHSYIGR